MIVWSGDLVEDSSLIVSLFLSKHYAVTNADHL